MCHYYDCFVFLRRDRNVLGIPRLSGPGSMANHPQNAFEPVADGNSSATTRATRLDYPQVEHSIHLHLLRADSLKLLKCPTSLEE